MKTIRIIAAAAILTAGLLVLPACSGTKKTAATKGVHTEKMTIPSVDLPHHSGLSMSVSPAISDGVPESVKVTLTNDTGNLAQFGAEYVVEHYNGKKWKVVPGTEKFPVIMILYSIPAGESQSYDFYLRGNVVDYEKGLYRLSKRVMLNNEHNFGVSAEFEIK